MPSMHLKLTPDGFKHCGDKDASAIKYGTDALGGVIIVNPAPLPESPGLGGSVNAILQSNGRSGTISGVLKEVLTTIKVGVGEHKAP